MNLGDSIDWLSVIDSFHFSNANAEEKLKANVVDTAVFTNGKIKYLYTDVDGFIALKPLKSLKQVFDNFSVYFSALSLPGNSVVALSKFVDTKQFAPVTLNELNDLCHANGPLPAKLETIQLFVGSKGDKKAYRTYGTSYWVDKGTSFPHMKCERLDVNSVVSGSHTHSSVLNQNRVANEIMESMCKRLVTKTQISSHCRVLSMSLEFVQDVNGKIWLIHMRDCSVSYGNAELPASPIAHQKRVSGTPGEYRQKRQALAIDYGDTGPVAAPKITDNLQHAEQRALLLSQSRDTGLARSLTPYVNVIGKNSEERIQQRLMRQSNIPPSEDQVNIIMNKKGKRNKSQTPGSGPVGDLMRSNSATRLLSPINDRRQIPTLSSSPVKHMGASTSSLSSNVSNLTNVSSTTTGTLNPLGGQTFSSEQSLDATLSSAAFRVPNARLSKDVPITESTAMFGSSQSTNSCQGDFCHLNMKYMQQRMPELWMNSKADESTDKSPSGKIKENKKGGNASIMERNSGLSDFRRRMLLCVDEGGASGKGKGTSFMSGVIKGVGEKDDDSNSKNGPAEESTGELMRIPFNQIVQARQEMPLVKLLLKRHRNDEEGDYMSEKNYQDIAVAEVLPAHYYHEANCCQVCHQIYQIIEVARQKALRKIEKSRSQGADSLYEPSFAKAAVTESKPKFESSKTRRQNAVIEAEAEESQKSVEEALRAIDTVTKEDIAELKASANPHPAVKIILEAVMCLLLGRNLQFPDIKKLISTGDRFHTLLRDFKLKEVTDSRLRMVQPYVENPVFRPENVVDISKAGSNFCFWVLGVVQAARWQRNNGHKRTNLLAPIQDTTSPEPEPSQSSFAQKLKKTKREAKGPVLMTTSLNDDNVRAANILRGTSNTVSKTDDVRGLITRETNSLHHPRKRKDATGPVSLSSSASYPSVEAFTGPGVSATTSMKEKAVLKAAQAKSAARLSSLNDNATKIVGDIKYFRCLDGITKMPYTIVGSLSLSNTTSHNLVVIHDFFDTCDATCILFKTLVQMHPGCQVVCFNYPGQAHTVWPRPPKAERDRGAVEPVLNNDWIADRVNELLKHVEEEGLILLSSRPFHIVGFGNGACIASAFAQRWGVRDPHYCNSIKSIISVNGFLAPDPQLTSVLHSASQIFESTPHNRPDIPISYWSRFIFSEDYLQRINPNLALNIFTAVSNPITNDGRRKLALGCLQHRDLRGGLSPDADLLSLTSHSMDACSQTYGRLPQYRDSQTSVNIPVIILQSTENSLVNASNVDSFLTGRTTKHLWSHQQNVLSEAALSLARDTSNPWVGGLSSGPQDYAKYSILGRSGLKMLVETMKNPRGAFVMWTRSGHIIQQENKTAVMDLLDAMICPTEEYTGLVLLEQEEDLSEKLKNFKNLSNMTAENSFANIGNEDMDATTKMDILFKIGPPKKVVIDGRTLPYQQEDRGEDHGMMFNKTGEQVPDEASVTVPSFTFEKGKVELNENEVTTNPISYETVNEETNQVVTETDESTTNAEAHQPIVMKRLDAAPALPQRDEHIPVKKIAQHPYVPITHDSILPVDESPVVPEPKPEPEPSVRAVSFSQDTLPLVAEASVNPVETQSDEAPVSSEPMPAPTAAPVAPAEPIIESPAPLPFVIKLPAQEPLVNEVPVPARTLTESPARPVLKSPTTVISSPIVVPHVMSPSVSSKSPSVDASSPSPVNLQPSKTLSKSQSKSRGPTPSDSPRVFVATKPTPVAPVPKLDNVVSTKDERDKNAWVDEVPSVSDSLALEVELARKQQEFQTLMADQEEKKANKEQEKGQRLLREQRKRIQQYEAEDRKLLENLQKELNDRRRERDVAEAQRRLELQALDEQLVASGVVDTYTGVAAQISQLTTSLVPMEAEDERDVVRELAPMKYKEPTALPLAITEKKDTNSMLDKMLVDEEKARKRGVMSMEDYEKVERQMAARQLERDQKLRHLGGDEQHQLFDNSARSIQRIGRGYNGRKRFKGIMAAHKMQLQLTRAITLAQALARGMLGRRVYAKLKRIKLQGLRFGASIIVAQRVFRGYLGRKYVRKIKRYKAGRNIQRVYRGHIGRNVAKKEMERLALLRFKVLSASKIQSLWRMKVAKEEFRSMRIHMLACIEIQRCFRGHIGRKIIERRRLWDATPSGPERIKLGLQIIEESKVAFERQQEEIDALHRAQERAEARVSHIRADLEDSNREIVVLERELQEIDQIERDLVNLTHERDLLANNVKNAAGLPRVADRDSDELVMGLEPTTFQKDPDAERRRRAETYALEMTIQIKRAEREKRKQELDTEFASVFQDVEKKKKALTRLEASLADMEQTRERKDREFRRLQKNLTQLLLEQKQELDDIREKGIELETATATTAAAATATAFKAREHEKQSSAMFSQTEELMKFQFMSMSLSYFSSLNMLKQLRDMNADTTSAAIASSADAAAAAAASATAANLPSVKKLDLGANDVVELAIQKKKAELEQAEVAERDANKSKQFPQPDNVRLWTVADVGRWLDTLSLSQYVAGFKDATVDGPFLMELREEDLVQVLGVVHKLHVRKILTFREKLKPLSEQELAKKEVVEREEKAEKTRQLMGVPSLDTVFSQARNGRNNRVEESLNLGFQLDAEDEKGNTLLLVAAQNSNRKLVEKLVVRGSNVNHQSVAGNTALHFALAFDPDGGMGEYLIEHGADDTLENCDGKTAYDGLAGI